MLVNDFQGVCSYPEAIDDDFITSQGMFPQPPAKTSLLAGFVAVSKLFRILSECFFHHRCILSELQTITTDWTVAAEERVHALLRDLPGAIQDPTTVPLEANQQVFATQRANILITVAIVKFALYDLRQALNVDEDQLAREREAIAREIHNLLMSIPVEDLASNGESVRAKVFHIACALCGQASTPGTDTDLVRDWCDMVSAVLLYHYPTPTPSSPAANTSSRPSPLFRCPFRRRTRHSTAAPTRHQQPRPTPGRRERPDERARSRWMKTGQGRRTECGPRGRGCFVVPPES